MDRAVRLVQFARKHLGKPYKYGAKPHRAPKEFDCSSFVQYLYRRIGIDLPRTALQQADKGREIDPKTQELKAGDLLFIKGGWGHYNPTWPTGIGHVGIYAGNGRVINARSNEQTGGKVIDEPVEAFTERADFVVAKRILT